ncbi:MAG: leucine-rich repeat domain-containing protein [Lachnospiraceae bacterium]|nr:leucine-rich repeat domain-containing protein [Lachnospiraceae bacterium]
MKNLMHRLFSIFILVAVFGTPLYNYAQTFSYNGINYSILDETEQTAVVGYNCYAQGDVCVSPRVLFNDKIYSVVAVCDSAFYLNNTVKSITFQGSGSLTEIGQYAFYGCTSLEKIILPETVSFIGSNAFGRCEQLADIKLPASLKTIYHYAFWMCTGLASITLPASVEYVRSGNVFAGCTSLTRINVEEGSQHYKSIDGVLYSYDGKKICAYPLGISDSYAIPEGVITIGEGAFIGHETLSGVTLPSTITSIEREAFLLCEGLTSIELPPVLNTIGLQAFTGCPLTSVKCHSLTPPTAPINIFDEDVYKNGRLWCPGESVDVYRNQEPWSKFKTIDYPYTMKFDINEDRESVALTSLDVKDYTTIHIPSVATVNGKSYPVTVIGPAAASSVYKLKEVVIPNSVTEIKGSAFNNCVNMTSVTLPESLTSIGNSAFMRCVSLKELDIPESVGSIGPFAFSGCSSMEHIMLPRSLTVIDAGLMSGCSALQSINIPESVTTINRSAFNGCENLKRIEIPAGVDTIDPSAFNDAFSLEMIEVHPDNKKYKSENGIVFTDDCKTLFRYPCGRVGAYTIPSDVDKLYGYAFQGSRNLSSVLIPHSIKTIDGGAFEDCASLECLEIPDNVTSIGIGAFMDCENLKKVKLPESIDIVPSSCFGGCSNLDNVTIPESVYIIEYGAFANCENLTKIAIPESVTNIYDDAFVGCTALEEIFIPNSVKEMGNSVFRYCQSLKNIHLPEGLTNLQYSTFEYCSSLEKIDIPSYVIAIGNMAFYGCVNLKEVLLPSGIAKIGASCWGECLNLKKIQYTASTPIEAEKNIFSDQTYGMAVLYCNGNNVSQYYKTMPWGLFGNIIGVEEETDGLSDTVVHEEQADIKVYDLSGRMVYSGSRSEMTLDSGFYILSQGASAKKIVVP